MELIKFINFYPLPQVKQEINGKEKMVAIICHDICIDKIKIAYHTMFMSAKETHLQIRIRGIQKKQLLHLAKQSGLTMSEWILQKLFPPKKEEWNTLIAHLSHAQDKSFVLAELNDLMASLNVSEHKEVFGDLPHNQLNDYWLNYLAAMVEHTCGLKGSETPDWVSQVTPLDKPVFVSELPSLRLHLLVNSPPAFRGRNIFVDSTIGARV